MATKKVDLNATLGLSGVVAKQTRRALVGASLGTAGNLVGASLGGLVSHVDLEAALSFSGSVSKKVTRPFAAFLMFAGLYPSTALYPSPNVYPGEPRVEAGQLTSVFKRAVRSLAGVVNPRARSGVVNPAVWIPPLYPEENLFPSPTLYPSAGQRIKVVGG